MANNDKLRYLRDLMEKYNIDAYIVESSDGHFSEYGPEFTKDRQWLTGFTGSNGFALVSQDEALVWTDGRYFIQAKDQLKGSGFEMQRLNNPDDLDIFQYINKHLKNKTIGLNPKSTSINYFKNLEDKLIDNTISYDIDLIEKLWTDRPTRDQRPAYIHEIKYAGKSANEKIQDVRKILEEKHAQWTIISSLDDIAWVFNIRGYDIKNNPYIISYAIIGRDSSHIFIDEEKLDQDLKDHLASENITYHPYENLNSFVKDNLASDKVYLDPSKSSIGLLSHLEEENLIYGDNITTTLKAKKTKIEIENQKNAYIKDGVALCKFIYWLKNHPDIRQEDETSARIYLDKLRQEQDLYVTRSFDTISAYGPSAAMMHYSDGGNGKKLDKRSFYLVDSGGQYLDGTTDTTRTISLGDLTPEEKTDYTLVLKGLIDLSTSVFLQGTTGSHLDAIARMPIWKNYMDYKCGTGHGIGYFLGVHEGPHSIRSGSFNKVELEQGMVVSIEPGIYKEGKHGIRLENIVYVKDLEENSDGKFMGFETMSFVPFDLDAIDQSLLNTDQRAALNSYHNEVYQKISPYLDEKEKKWLKEVTRQI